MAVPGREALLRDMTKETPARLQLLRRYGILFSEWEETAPNACHTLTGRKEDGFTEEALLDIERTWENGDH
ncbi:MAG: hypothetical protein LBH95_06485 [Oscillospiraceae bacterium]|jgi:succinate dehydrogenase/fumarate reductase flavoprotein subunit|nr:hypothetical protein [Oscillospiraceae bacterium]